MDHDYVPAWLVSLLVVFGIATAAALLSFLIFHAEHAAVQEDVVRLNTEITQLKGVVGDLKDQIPPLEEGITLRREKLKEIEDSDQDAINGDIKGTFEPKHKEALAAIRTALENRERTFRKELDNMAVARKELGSQEVAAMESERRAQEERDRLRLQVQEAAEALERFKRTHREEILVLEKDVKDRTERVEELLDRRDIKTDELISDGRVLQAKAEDGFVIIDRGMDHDLRPYTRFVVYNRRGGQNRIKGEIEVIEVDARMSVARVLDERDPNDPIIAGDHIHNNIYNPDEVKIFVIAGDFKLFNQRELQRFIEEAGGKIEPKITRRTHYLVAGENADVALHDASLNGITILSEQQVLDLVRRPERYKLRQGMVFVIAGEFSSVDRGVIERFVKANGGVLKGSVGADIDVLIAGDGAADEISAARLQGASVIDQRQLIHLMGASPAAK